MTITFDTLKFANKLKAVGIDSRIAEAQAEAHAEALAETASVLATKQDLDKLKNELIIKLGGIVVSVGGLLGALLAIFHIAG